MLAASPSPSPSSFRYTTSRNGQGGSMHPSHKLSPRDLSNSLQISPNSATDISLTLPPLSRPSYQNASTQYSPMRHWPGESTLAAPLDRVLPEANTPATEDTELTKISYAATTTTADPSLASPLATQLVQTVQPQAKSLHTKRRQFRESIELGSPPTRPEPSFTKRPRSSKVTVKVLPVRYELCDAEDMVILIADMISELIETNDNLPLRDVVLTRFHSRTPPGISVKDYLQRLAKHAALTPPLLLSMVYYIDRLCSLYPAFTITTLTVHRFLITAATVAAKGLSDSFWNNSTYARVGGIKLAELGLLELEFLYRVDWRIVPNPEVLVDYYRGLIARTDDYILESDIDATEGGDVEVNKTVMDEKTKATSQDMTDMKWEEWMKDVADGSESKKAEMIPP